MKDGEIGCEFLAGLEAKELDTLLIATDFGPGTMTETISIYTYLQGFRQFETSYTAAMAVVVILLLTLIVMQALRWVEIAR